MLGTAFLDATTHQPRVSWCVLRHLSLRTSFCPFSSKPLLTDCDIGRLIYLSGSKIAFPNTPQSPLRGG